MEFTLCVTSFSEDKLDKGLFQIPPDYKESHVDLRDMWIVGIGQQLLTQFAHLVSYSIAAQHWGRLIDKSRLKIEIMYLNEIKLIGFVGQDAKLKSSQNSKELVRFDVATKVSWKNRDSVIFLQLLIAVSTRLGLIFLRRRMPRQPRSALFDYEICHICVSWPRDPKLLHF